MRIRDALRFRLRTLLLLMVPLGIALAVLTARYREAQRQRAVVDAWRAGGVTVELSTRSSFWPAALDTGYLLRVDRLIAVSSSRLPELNSLAEMKNLRRLTLWQQKNISDLRPIAGLTRLQYLDIEGTQVKDLSPLAGLNKLTTLNLAQIQLKDTTLLAGLTKLQTLDLSHTPVRDIAPLTGLVELKTLQLVRTQVEDLSPLAGLGSCRASTFRIPK